MQNKIVTLKESPLGKKTTYTSSYDPSLLFPIFRIKNRETIGVPAILPFKGKDIWTAFELSWLNEKGKPIVGCAYLSIPCDTPKLIESKSLKLYFNSFNNTHFTSFDAVYELISRDLSEALGGEFQLELFPLAKAPKNFSPEPKGICLDDLDLAFDTYTIQPLFLKTENELIIETLYSDLLKSNCLVTGQPDWGSMEIAYTGRQIEHAGLLKYIVSFRNCNEFAETCVERVFMDIMKHCAPEKLLVHTRFTRRGGLDINPYRANYEVEVNKERLWRQ